MKQFLRFVFPASQSAREKDGNGKVVHLNFNDCHYLPPPPSLSPPLTVDWLPLSSWGSIMHAHTHTLSLTHTDTPCTHTHTTRTHTHATANPIFSFHCFVFSFLPLKSFNSSRPNISTDLFVSSIKWPYGPSDGSLAFKLAFWSNYDKTEKSTYNCE